MPIACPRTPTCLNEQFQVWILHFFQIWNLPSTDSESHIECSWNQVIVQRYSSTTSMQKSAKMVVHMFTAQRNKLPFPYIHVLFWTTLRQDPRSHQLSDPGGIQPRNEHSRFRAFGDPSGYVSPPGLSDDVNGDSRLGKSCCLPEFLAMIRLFDGNMAFVCWRKLLTLSL